MTHDTPRWMRSWKYPCVFLVTAALLTVSACGHHHDVPHDHHGHDEDPHIHDKKTGIENVALTGWTARTELYLEYPPLIRGTESEFLAHLTDLVDYKPVSEGGAAVVVSGPNGEKSFSVDAPSRPGLFKPVVRLDRPGDYAAKLRVRSGRLNDEHDLGTLRVHPDITSARAAATQEPPSPAIPFLKEQQWLVDFAVEPAAVRALQLTVPVPATIRAHTERPVAVQSPLAGVVEGSLPALGASVHAGGVLAAISTAAGSQKIKSSVPGVVAVVHVSAGDAVEPGQTLFTLLDLSRVWVEARVYEADLPRAIASTRAFVEIPGFARRESRIVHSGGTLDAATRTVPFVFEMDNRDGLVRLGMTGQAHIVTAESSSGVAIPASAVLDEGGRPTAYVQVSGESFERRLLKPGMREGDWVQIREGIKPGERVVTKGALHIRLAASSGAVPAHLH